MSRCLEIVMHILILLDDSWCLYALELLDTLRHSQLTSAFCCLINSSDTQISKIMKPSFD